MRAGPVRRPLRRDARSAHGRQLLRAAVTLGNGPGGHAPRKCLGCHSVAVTPGIHGEAVAAWSVGDRRRPARAGSPARTCATRTAATGPLLDVELLVPPLVVVLGDAPMSLQYAGSWVQV
jgi:hypothetical protein